MVGPDVEDLSREANSSKFKFLLQLIPGNRKLGTIDSKAQSDVVSVLQRMFAV